MRSREDLAKGFVMVNTECGCLQCSSAAWEQEQSQKAEGVILEGLTKQEGQIHQEKQ